jgi:hypothetical protein
MPGETSEVIDRECLTDYGGGGKQFFQLSRFTSETL